MPASEIIDGTTFARLLDSLGGDVDFLSELMDAYLVSTPELFAGMRQALATGEATGLQRAAHSLKTGSAGFGAMALAAQCKELEDMGKAGTLDGAEAKVSALEVTYAAAVAALRARVETAPSAPADELW
jgi:two-component system, sensor histidine kinase and response regulator